YALKLIRDLVVKRQGKLAIEREVLCLQKLSDSKISSALHYFSSTGKKWDALTQREETKTYLVIDLMERGDLFDLIASCKKPLPKEIVRFFFKQLVDAMVLLHKKNIAHRDLKL